MSASEREKNPPAELQKGRFVVDKRLGAGCFGQVHKGYDNHNKRQVVAIKFEPQDKRGGTGQLEQEASILRDLATPAQVQGFVECIESGVEGHWNWMVMEILGKSLEERLQSQKGKKFNVKTTVLIADQVLQRIEYLHSRGIVHRDIKPENFMFGYQQKQHHIYLIDFGLSKHYWEYKNRRHVPFRNHLSLTGTARYASINTHTGHEQSRRDDLEAIGHMLAYFLRGSLPWSGLDAKTQEEKYSKICHKKQTFPLADLCAGYPDAFEKYLRQTRGLEFKQRPNYFALRQLFRDVRDDISHREGQAVQDHDFPWCSDLDPTKIVALTQVQRWRQPDDTKKQGSIFAACFGKCGSASSPREP